MTNLPAQDLIDFEREIADLFNAKKIKAPVHLYSGGEEELIAIFKNVHPQDWVLCSWRSHYQCLLKGVPPDELRAKILAGHSIALCFPEYNVLSSALVGGVLPIAVGLAMGLQRRDQSARVHCFLGDMTVETGIAHESIKYALNHDLPVHFHVEDNGLSVCTDTKKAWGTHLTRFTVNAKIDRFSYTPGRYPHAGAGERVQF
jgi:pyruvate dehydrogenase E1 component alpha subunit